MRACSKFLQYSINVLTLNGIYNTNSAEELSKSILELYKGKNRYYHNYNHIVDMFDNVVKHFHDDKADLIKTSLKPSELLAILFHDIIYVPGQKDNEGRSVDLMIAMMAGYGVPLTEFDWSSRIIKETKNYLGHVRDSSTHAVLDLDLISLSCDFKKFIKDNKNVECEFGGLNKSNINNRIKFFVSMLSKNDIYYNLKELDSSARHNMYKYIEILEDLREKYE